MPLAGRPPNHRGLGSMKKRNSLKYRLKKKSAEAGGCGGIGFSRRGRFAGRGRASRAPPAGTNARVWGYAESNT
ncbi:unnamed protein product [Pieris brassicae]|uniref:Uncharacterized protein n=1 Tax=Pieris brassicae TaxID=7116 RepID=A0A9P0TLH6_PIEBR|nr:unnamed protein product [Pieris brassicae]